MVQWAGSRRAANQRRATFAEAWSARKSRRSRRRLCLEAGATVGKMMRPARSQRTFSIDILLVVFRVRRLLYSVRASSLVSRVR